MSVFFSFVIKAFVSFEKLIIFHRQAFVLYKNGENLKVLIKIFRQKLLVSSVILAFLDHLKLKFFFLGHSVANIEGPPRPPPLFKIFGSAPVALYNLRCPVLIFCYHNILHKNDHFHRITLHMSGKIDRLSEFPFSSFMYI